MLSLAGSGAIVERRASIGHESVWIGEGALGAGAVVTRAVITEYEPSALLRQQTRRG